MSGILFLRTQQLEALKTFYTATIGADVWLDQDDCCIFRHGNFLFGFCTRDAVDTHALLTFVYDNPARVDAMYDIMKDRAAGAPSHNDKYAIYQFFATDPEGRMLEFQHFDSPPSEFRAGDDLLRTRRSVREFADTPVSDELLRRVIDLARYAPSAYNHQPCYYIPVRDRSIIEQIAKTRDDASAPIAHAKMAVAIVVDTSVTEHHLQDGHLAAYHFQLAAWFCGLGTCWIDALNCDDVKTALGIPPSHYVTTVMPLGYPANSIPGEPSRLPLAHYLRRD
ncbi:MAG: nitroreductase family protein [candidate division Zixibacteria bacterium]|nr:nitroreductase family protein [candidate division Zixibacteria bacterium]